MHRVCLKKGKEAILKSRHHWIFSGAIASYSEGYADGELALICSYEGNPLGWGFFNRRCSLAGRIVSFSTEDPYLTMREALLKALHLRSSLLNSTKTTALRLVNGEADSLPSLIVDKYGPYLVVQAGSLGCIKLLPFFIEQLKGLLEINGIYDKSCSSSLKEEGIEPKEHILWGEIPDVVTVKEEGIDYKVSIKTGQKTGFFLDQREMRKKIWELSLGKKVLNAFCYTGGFSVSALAGGALSVDSVDISPTAMQLCQENVLLNGNNLEKARFFQEDVFDFLESHPLDYDIIILDPPAFAKKKKDIPAAVKGYKRLFGLAAHKAKPGTLLLLSSCSYYISEELFENCVRLAISSAKRPAQIIGRHIQAIDHPVNLFHPESSYLKSLLISV